jgi:hypothetical protein
VPKQRPRLAQTGGDLSTQFHGGARRKREISGQGVRAASARRLSRRSRWNWRLIRGDPALGLRRGRDGEIGSVLSDGLVPGRQVAHPLRARWTFSANPLGDGSEPFNVNLPTRNAMMYSLAGDRS